MDLTPQLEINSRMASFQEKLSKQELTGALIILNSDLFYFAGTVQNSFLYVPAQGEAVLMVKKSLHRAQEETVLKNIVAIRSPKEISTILASFGYTDLTKIGMELDVLPFNLYKMYKSIFPSAELCDVSPIIKEIRAIKSPYEIGILRSALVVADQAFQRVPDLLHEGMSEIELAALFEGELRKRGHGGCCKVRAFNQEFFFGAVCSGANGFIPSFFDGPIGGAGVCVSHPNGAGWKKINRNEPVLIDYTTIIQGYTGDQTRMFAIGALSSKMEQAYQAALLIEAEVLKVMKPGTPMEVPYLLALKLAGEMGYQDNFMGYKQDRVKFLGHGIGLELDEWPIFAKGLKQPLLPGMTFALEPKFVFLEGAIGIENSFVMTETGPESLSITPETITYVK